MDEGVGDIGPGGAKPGGVVGPTILRFVFVSFN